MTNQQLEDLKYLLSLKKHCEDTDMRFSVSNTKKLNELLIAYHAKHLSSYEEKEK
tara:strand:+ start:826 stop:990 length:165 start_codon:yes stop_codon:yes gene_type:complete